MGIRLVREVLDHAPAGLTPAERLILVVIAEAANDATREGWPGMEALARRSGLSTVGVTKAIQRMGRRGMDVRVAIATGGDGRPVYALRGRRTMYRLPRLQRVDGGPPSDGERVDGGPLKGGPPSGKGGPPSTPSPQVPSENPHLSSSAARRLAAHGATEREIEHLLNKIKTERKVYNLGAYLARLDQNGDMADLIAQARRDLTHTDSRDQLRQFRESIRDAERCEHGEPGGHIEGPGQWFACVAHRMLQRRA